MFNALMIIILILSWLVFGLVAYKLYVESNISKEDLKRLKTTCSNYKVKFENEEIRNDRLYKENKKLKHLISGTKDLIAKVSIIDAIPTITVYSEDEVKKINKTIEEWV